MARLVGGSRHGGTDGPLGLDIRDFGPIERASVRLRPLTVFIGPNNSGKSYAARLLHSVVATLAGLPVHAAESDGAQSACRRMVGRRYDGKGRQARLGGADSQRAAKALIEAAFSDGLRLNLERNFESTAAGLVRAGQARSSLTISEGGESSRPRLGVAIGLRDHLAVTAGFKGGWGEIVLAYGRGMCTASIFDGGAGGNPGAHNGARAKFRYAESGARPRPTGDRGEAIPLLSSALADAIARDVQYGAAHDASFYLPAGRSAIMQSYKELAAGLAAGAPRSGSNSDGVPRMQGAVSDLVAEIMRLGGKRTGTFSGWRGAWSARCCREACRCRMQAAGDFRTCCTIPTGGACPCRSHRRRSRRLRPCRCTSSMSWGAAACWSSKSPRHTSTPPTW